MIGAKDNLIKIYGSYEAYRQHMREIAKRPRPNQKGSFKNKELASRAGKISRRNKISDIIVE